MPWTIISNFFKVEVVVVQLVGVPYFGAAVGILASNYAVCKLLVIMYICSITNSMNFHV